MNIQQIKDFAKNSYTLLTLTRYNTEFRLINENVSSHSYFVTLFTHLFYYHFKLKHNINYKKMIDMALTHDVHEIFTGDVTFKVKKKFEELNKVLQKIELKSMKMLFGHDYYVNLLSEFNKCESVESRIVRLADLLDCIIFAEHEVKLGNSNFERVLKESNNRFDEILKLLEVKDEKT